MINYKNLYAGAMVLNEFKEKLKALCDEYTQKLNKACPENYASDLWDECSQTVRSINILFGAKENHVTLDELVSEGFVYKRTNEFGDFLEKQINGIKVTCCIKNDFTAEGNASNIGRIMKDLYAGVMVLNEFKEKLKTLCDEYTRKRAEVCPENYALNLWNERSQNVNGTWIQISAEDNHITRDELVSANFAYKSGEICDWYEKEINGILITYSMSKSAAKKKNVSEKCTMTDIEKTNEITRIIASLREKYSLEDIKCILKDSRIKVITLINYGDYLPEETGGPLIDESDLPF